MVTKYDILHETCIGAQSDQSKIIQKICESVFVFSQQVRAWSLVRSGLVMVDKSVGETMVSGLSFATGLPVLAEQ